MIQRRPTILVILDHFYPGFKAGGPNKSIKNLIENCYNEFDFKIITNDRDLGDDTPYENIESNKWHIKEKFSIIYLTPRKFGFFNLSKLINQTTHDILYLNSFFSLKSTIFPLLALKLGCLIQKKVVLVPRGEFEPGCLSLKKYKKSFYLWLFKLSSIQKQIIFQATSLDEISNISKQFELPANHIVLAKNMVAFSEKDITIKDKGNVLKICFISRLTREKNLDFALKIIDHLPFNIEFNIFGTNHEDPKYWSYCNKIISESSKNITYQGYIQPEQIRTIFNQHDLFLFPSKGENFAHVIYESLSVGTPVLISNMTPWKNLEELNIGWDLNLDVDNFVDKIVKLHKMPNSQYLDMRVACLKFARSYASDNEKVSYFNLFNNLLTNGN
jgi:glycosyltransferase involved in cell wall biosynthesis